MGAAPLPRARRGSRPRRSGGALLRPCQAFPTLGRGGPEPLPVPGAPRLLVRDVVLPKEFARSPPSWREASPASRSRAQGAGDEPALDCATPRGSGLCWPRPEPPGAGDRLCAPHGMFWRGRGRSRGRIGGRQRDPGWPQFLLCPGLSGLPGQGPGWESGLEVRPRAHADLSPASLVPLRPDATQEANSEKTNNGIHYRLQLLYSNGEAPSAAGTWGSGRGWGRGQLPGRRAPARLRPGPPEFRLQRLHLGSP